MMTEDDPVVMIRSLMAEELHLVGQEVEDSLPAGQAGRRRQVTSALDEVERLVSERRRTRPRVPATPQAGARR